MAAPFTVEKKPTLLGLHLVRGLCAITVVIYHYLHEIGVGTYYAAGTYGVYIFFALSGFALTYIYGDKALDRDALANFYTARIFRVAPLFALVATYQLLWLGVTDELIMLYLLNITLIFGLATPGATSMVPAGWSVGIEAALYLLFPVLLLAQRVRSILILFATCALLNHVYVSATYSIPRLSDDHWAFYTQVPTFLVYFVGGILIARSHARLVIWTKAIPGWWFFGTAATVGLMAAMFSVPHLADISRQSLLSEWQAKVMIAGCFLVIGIASTVNLSGPLGRLSAYLGDISFALYLVHYPVWYQVQAHVDASIGVRALLAMAISVGLASLIYPFFERPMLSLRKHFIR